MNQKYVQVEIQHFEPNNEDTNVRRKKYQTRNWIVSVYDPADDETNYYEFRSEPQARKYFRCVQVGTLWEVSLFWKIQTNKKKRSSR